MGPRLAPLGLSEGQLGGPPVSQAAPRTGWSEQQAASLNVGKPWLLPTAYGRPPLALLPRRWVPGSADGATQAHTRCQRRDWWRKAVLAPAQATSTAQTPPPVSTGTRCSSLFFASSWASIWRSLSSMLLCLSLLPVGQEQRQLRSQQPCPDSTRAVIAGAASGPCSVRTTGPGFARSTPACLLTQPARLRV